MYADGRRRPGSADLASARAAAAATDGFVWIGLSEPTADGVRRARDGVRAAPARGRRRRQGAPAAQARAVRRADVRRRQAGAVRRPRGGGRRQRAGDLPRPRLRHHRPARLHRRPARGPGTTSRPTRPCSRTVPRRCCTSCLDLVVDDYLDVVDAIEVDVDRDRGGGVQRRGARPRRADLQAQARGARLPSRRRPAGQPRCSGSWPARCGGWRPEALPYFRDVHDHLLRAADAIEGYDDLLSRRPAGRPRPGHRRAEPGRRPAERGHAEDLRLGGDRAGARRRSPASTA